MKTILKYLSLIIVFAILYYIIKRIGLKEILNNLTKADPIFIIIAFILTTIYYLIWNLRWYLIIKDTHKTSYFKIIPIFLTGVLFNTITPSARFGGEPFRAYYLSKEYKITKTRAFATTVIDKIYNFIVFSILSIFSILFVISYIKINVLLKTLLITCLVIVLAAILLLFVFHKKRDTKKTFKLHKLLPIMYNFFLFKFIRNKFETCEDFMGFVNKKIDTFVKFLKKHFKKKKNILNGLVTTTIFWLIKFIVVYFLFLSLNHPIDIMPIIIVVTISNLLGDLSFTPGGIGIIEALMITLYYSFGINPAIAVIVTLLSRAMFYFYALGFGGLSFIYLTLKIDW